MSSIHEESISPGLLIQILTSNPGMESLCVRHGKICGIMPMAYTWAILFGIDRTGYERRYCYESHHEALAALRDWNGAEGTHPGGNWVKLKGTFLGHQVDMLNPNLEV